MISPKYLLTAAGILYLVSAAGLASAGDGIARMSDLRAASSSISVRQVAFAPGKKDCGEEEAVKAGEPCGEDGAKIPCGEADGGGQKAPCGELAGDAPGAEGCNDAETKRSRRKKKDECADQNGGDGGPDATEGCSEDDAGCSDGSGRKKRRGLLSRLLGGGGDSADDGAAHGGNGAGGHAANCPPGGSIYHPLSPHALNHGQHGGSSIFGHCPNGHGNGAGYCDPHAGCHQSALQCLFGWAIPSGNCGQGLPVIGKYHTVYAQQPGYLHPADGQTWATGHDGMPVVVPVPPGVNYQYNYSAGMPSSRITTIGTWNPQTRPARMMFQSW